MGGMAGVNFGNSSYSSASNFARTYGSEASARSESAAALANNTNAQTMQMIMDFNHNEALLQREWEERLSNTAYQRAITDMKAAGINPILAATNGGASTPSGASASGSALSAAMANTYADSISGGSSYSSSIDNFANALTTLGQSIVSAINGAGGVAGAAEQVGEGLETFTKGTVHSAEFKEELTEWLGKIFGGKNSAKGTTINSHGSSQKNGKF